MALLQNSKGLCYNAIIETYLKLFVASFTTDTSNSIGLIP